MRHFILKNSLLKLLREFPYLYSELQTTKMSESKSNQTPPTSTKTQVPLKKRKLSENDTTEITTTEDKRPSKNLIQLNLPKSLQTNIGKCQPNLGGLSSRTR